MAALLPGLPAGTVRNPCAVLGTHGLPPLGLPSSPRFPLRPHLLCEDQHLVCGVHVSGHGKIGLLARYELKQPLPDRVLSQGGTILVAQPASAPGAGSLLWPRGR